MSNNFEENYFDCLDLLEALSRKTLEVTIPMPASYFNSISKLSIQMKFNIFGTFSTPVDVVRFTFCGERLFERIGRCSLVTNQTIIFKLFLPTKGDTNDL